MKREVIEQSWGSLIAAVILACWLCAPVFADVSIIVDTAGRGTLTGPAGAFTLVVLSATDPGPGGATSALAYNLLNPPDLVFGDVQLVSNGGVTDLIRFNSTGTGSPSYQASLLYYSNSNDGFSHLVRTPTPPGAYYPNVISSPKGAVYTPGPGQPGYVSTITTHYTFSPVACTYTFSQVSASFGSAGGTGSFTVTPAVGCPITASSQADFVTLSVSGSTVTYTVAANSNLSTRTGTISVGGQPFTVTQFGGGLSILPMRLSFTSGPVTPPQSQTVTIDGGAGAPFDISVDSPWLTVTRSSTQFPSTLTVNVSPVGLTPGIHTGTITLNVGGLTQPIFVQYFIQGLPSLVTVPAQLTFNYSTGGPALAQQQLSIYSTSAVAFQVAGSSFVSVTPGSGTTTQFVTVTVDPSKLGAGTYPGTVTVTASGVTNSPLVVPVTLIVTSSGPQFTALSVVNAASFQPGPIAPGSLFTISGTGLANSSVTAAGPGLPTTMGGVSMTVGGIPVPLAFVSPGQINAQVPFEVGLGQQTLGLTVNGVTISVQVMIVAAAPGIFQVGGRGAILNQDFSLNGPSNAAAVGSTVLVFFTGQGLVNPSVTTDAPAPITPLSFTNATTTATIGTQPAKVIFSGLAPGFLGLGQANVIVPSLLTNDYPLMLTVNGVQSNAGTVAVLNPL